MPPYRHTSLPCTSLYVHEAGDGACTQPCTSCMEKLECVHNGVHLHWTYWSVYTTVYMLSEDIGACIEPCTSALRILGRVHNHVLAPWRSWSVYMTVYVFSGNNWACTQRCTSSVGKLEWGCSPMDKILKFNPTLIQVVSKSSKPTW